MKIVSVKVVDRYKFGEQWDCIWLVEIYNDGTQLLLNKYVKLK